MSRPPGSPNKLRLANCYPGEHTFAIHPELAKEVAQLAPARRRLLDLHLRHTVLIWMLNYDATRQT